MPSLTSGGSEAEESENGNGESEGLDEKREGWGGEIWDRFSVGEVNEEREGKRTVAKENHEEYETPRQQEL